MKKADFLRSHKHDQKSPKETLCLIPMASGFWTFKFLEKVSQRRWRAFLSRSFHLCLSELRRTPGLLWTVCLGSCTGNQRDKTSLDSHVISNFWGRFPCLEEHTWGITCVFPSNRGKNVSLLLAKFTFWCLGCCSGFNSCCAKLFICTQKGCGQKDKDDFQTLFPSFMKVLVKK